MDVATWRTARLGLAAICSSLFLSGCGNPTQTVATTFPETKAECSATAVPNRFLVHWKDGSTTVESAKDRDQLIEKLIEPKLEKIQFAEQDQVVRLGEPGQVMAADTISEDVDWGQRIIEAPEAWAQGYSGQGVIVAVVDSGADTTHPQLRSQLYVNTGEIPNNGIDDDNNGFVDDVSGFDFEQSTGNVTDGSGHGTHVSGIIAADPSQGAVQGIAYSAKVLPLDFMSNQGSGNISDAIRAMDYAASRGAKVINASWGGAPCSKSLQAAMQRLAAKDILFVSASGNSGRNLESNPEFPAAYGLSSQLTVGASTSRDYMAGFSNYSYSLVHIMAPGSSIVSTYPNNRTAAMSGTSMATPFVSAAAAVLWSARPTATLAQVRAALLNSVDVGSFEVSTRGRLNLRKALAELTATLP